VEASGNLALNESHVANPAEIQAAVLVEPQHYEIQHKTQAACGPDEVTVRLEGCGVCASNIPVWEGRSWFEYPMAPGAPGHEGWGRIIDVGDAVKGLEVGQRVACLGDAAFAETMNVAADQVVPLPKALDGVPFPGEAIGCAMNIFRRSDISAGQSVAIIGAGFLGLLLVQLAVDAGADVYVLSRRDSVRDLAKELGAKATFDTEDWWGNALKVVEMTEQRGCDRVIEVTGMQFALDTATQMIAEYGKLIIAGFHQDGLREVNMQTWNWRAIDVINAHERDPKRYRQGIEEGIEATVNDRIRPQDLLTHKFSLEKLDDAFQMMIDRPDGFIKGWVQL
jgi:2-desacetyl-2-hydroxyethyl bacteriochlorophyllide A dehydrogenase